MRGGCAAATAEMNASLMLHIGKQNARKLAVALSLNVFVKRTPSMETIEVQNGKRGLTYARDVEAQAIVTIATTAAEASRSILAGIPTRTFLPTWAAAQIQSSPSTASTIMALTPRGIAAGRLEKCRLPTVDILLIPYDIRHRDVSRDDGDRSAAARILDANIRWRSIDADAGRGVAEINASRSPIDVNVVG